jgi:hypothetical protein
MNGGTDEWPYNVEAHPDRGDARIGTWTAETRRPTPPRLPDAWAAGPRRRLALTRRPRLPRSERRRGKDSEGERPDRDLSFEDFAPEPKGSDFRHLGQEPQDPDGPLPARADDISEDRVHGDGSPPHVQVASPAPSPEERLADSAPPELLPDAAFEDRSAPDPAFENHLLPALTFGHPALPSAGRATPEPRLLDERADDAEDDQPLGNGYGEPNPGALEGAPRASGSAVSDERSPAPRSERSFDFEHALWGFEQAISRRPARVAIARPPTDIWAPPIDPDPGREATLPDDARLGAVTDGRFPYDLMADEGVPPASPSDHPGDLAGYDGRGAFDPLGPEWPEDAYAGPEDGEPAGPGASEGQAGDESPPKRFRLSLRQRRLG